MIAKKESLVERMETDCECINHTYFYKNIIFTLKSTYLASKPFNKLTTNEYRQLKIILRIFNNNPNRVILNSDFLKRIDNYYNETLNLEENIENNYESVIAYMKVEA